MFHGKYNSVLYKWPVLVPHMPRKLTILTQWRKQFSLHVIKVAFHIFVNSSFPLAYEKLWTSDIPNFIYIYVVTYTMIVHSTANSVV